MALDPAKAAVLFPIASLVIDRLVNATILVASFRNEFPDPQLADGPTAVRNAERLLRIYSWMIAAVLSTIAVVVLGLRIFEAIGLQVDATLDSILTIVALAGGADFVSSVLRVRGGFSEIPAAQQKPLEVTGKLILEEPQERTAVHAA
jgi:hypothetical protein